jgi:hypothetical protein
MVTTCYAVWNWPGPHAILTLQPSNLFPSKYNISFTTVFEIHIRHTMFYVTISQNTAYTFIFKSAVACVRNFPSYLHGARFFLKLNNLTVKKFPTTYISLVHYRVHKNQMSYVILFRLNLLQYLKSYSLKIHFNIILPLRLCLRSFCSVLSHFFIKGNRWVSRMCGIIIHKG